MKQLQYAKSKSHAATGLTCLALLGTACAGPRMVAPADVASSSRVLEAKDRSSATGALVDESFRLGDWKVTEVDRDWTSKSGFSVGSYGQADTTTGYSYQLNASKTWKGSCASVKKEKAMGNFSFGNKSNLLCECKTGKSSVTAAMSGSNPKKHEKGEIKLGSKKYELSVINETEGSNFTGLPAGYRVDDRDTAVGAVETLNPGRVWLNKELAEGDAEAVSCTLVGLMLYVPPSDN